jgi:hypothetical protein
MGLQTKCNNRDVGVVERGIFQRPNTLSPQSPHNAPHKPCVCACAHTQQVATEDYKRVRQYLLNGWGGGDGVWEGETRVGGGACG